MMLAYKSVITDMGASGIVGIGIDEIKEYVNSNWKDIKIQLQERRYQLVLERRAEISKPNGEIRNLGIPTVMDKRWYRCLHQHVNSILVIVVMVFDQEEVMNKQY